MKRYLYFGENVSGYDIPVINEREARAGAGILLLPAITSFLISFLTHEFTFTKIFVTLFMVDFFIRIFINPKFAPSLILGRIAIQNQTAEYVGAPQKKFAWSIGFILSIVMFFMIVIFEIMTPIKIIICLLCIALLFSETAFGICLGCIIYHKTQKNTLKYCPGNVCEMKEKEEIQKISNIQYIVLGIFFIGLFVLSNGIIKNEENSVESSMKCATGKCSIGKCGS
jgi:succinate dehydrogenase hydrophobic anchor subunit